MPEFLKQNISTAARSIHIPKSSDKVSHRPEIPIDKSVVQKNNKKAARILGNSDDAERLYFKFKLNFINLTAKSSNLQKAADMLKIWDKYIPLLLFYKTVLMTVYTSRHMHRGINPGKTHHGTCHGIRQNGIPIAITLPKTFL